ncbi:MAG TPA: hypothetical protein VGC82_00160, partial [Rhodopila sp.]
IQANPALARARSALDGLNVFHFPVAFPEVFLRRRPGFDVILGNSPWQEVTLEELVHLAGSGGPVRHGHQRQHLGGRK